MRKDIFSKTRKNVMIMSIGIVMSTLLTFALITEVIYRNNLFDTVDKELQTHKNMILNEAHIKYNGDTVVEVILPSPLVRELINFVWQGDTLVKDSPHAYKGSKKYPEFKDQVGEGLIQIEDDGYYYRGLQFMLKDCKIQLLLSVDEEMTALNNLRRALLIAFVILLFIALVLAYYLARLALRPLYVTYNKQVRFVQDASHEMRTPLAVIRGKMELLARSSKDTIEEHFDELSSMMSEMRGLEKMNKDLLLLSKEDMKGILAVSEVSVQKFFTDIAQLYQDLAEIHQITFSYEGLNEEKAVWWDEVKVKRCISILLENAIKYSEAGDEVRLSVVMQEKYLRVKVEDTGKGIKKEELPHIFERFYRSKEVRGAGIEGSGIGLSLLQSLCYTMGIKVKVNSVYLKGTSFSLDIPVKMTD